MSHRYVVKTNTGCSHDLRSPCSRCWYDGLGKYGHLQGTQPFVARGYLMPAFPSELMLDNAFDPWEPVRPVSSREEMRQLCLKQGVDSLYLKESSVWRSGERRWI